MPDAENLLADRSDATTGAPEVSPGRTRTAGPRPDLGWRALVALAAILAAVVGAPAYVVGGLVAVALCAAVERLARSRGHGPADSLLVLAGGTLAAVVLTGLVLGSTPVGLSTTTWAVGLSLVSLGALAVALVLPRPARMTRGAWAIGARALPWAVVVVAVAVVAITVSVRSVGPSETPPLQMSLGTVAGTQAQVVLSSAERAGPLELRTTNQDGDEISYPLFSIGADQTYRTTVTVPRDGRFTISVNYPDQTQPLRTLVLDR